MCVARIYNSRAARRSLVYTGSSAVAGSGTTAARLEKRFGDVTADKMRTFRLLMMFALAGCVTGAAVMKSGADAYTEVPSARCTELCVCVFVCVYVSV
jgi:hypothetical protein